MTDFKEEVYKLVSSIPEGRVMTYGQIAALCGQPRAARVVGGIAHHGPTHLHTTSDCPLAKPAIPQKFSANSFVDDSGARSSYNTYDSQRSTSSPRSSDECEACGGLMIPWQRIVNKQGGLASGYWGGKNAHKAVLETEGIKVKNYSVDVDNLLWWPEEIQEDWRLETGDRWKQN